MEMMLSTMKEATSQVAMRGTRRGLNLPVTAATAIASPNRTSDGAGSMTTTASSANPMTTARS